MPDLHVLTDRDVAAGVAALEWAGPTVPPGHTVRTGYVPIHDVVFFAPFGHQLLPAEVERAYRQQLELDGHQVWPPPTGYWRHDRRFVLTDGRNRYVASLMLGVEYLLVAWLIPGIAGDDTGGRRLQHDSSAGLD